MSGNYNEHLSKHLLGKKTQVPTPAIDEFLQGPRRNINNKLLMSEP